MSARRRSSSGSPGYWRREPHERLAALAALCDDVVDMHLIRSGLGAAIRSS